ncbi:MAG: TIGR00282 family metallophosphoesterase [Fibrobacter sp.]|nr:TIGR00282 family metallophosphoesterase [Fibrobacter sp.]
MKILFIGDIFGQLGRRVLAHRLKSLIEEYSIDVCVGNGENSAGGRGLTSNIFKKLRKYGVQVITGGNHSFSVQDNDFSVLDIPTVLRPYNFPPGNMGHGSTIFELDDGRTLGVINLQGRTFFRETLDDPFRVGKEEIERIKEFTPHILIDFHAEATSEKLAFAYYVDGLVSAVLGTHTHVQTADEKILPKGTAFISDVGMTGPEDSVIGMCKKEVIHRFLYQTPVRFNPAVKGPILNCVIIETDDTTGNAVSIKRIFERIVFV